MDLISPMWWRVVAPAACVMAASLSWGTFWPRCRWFGPLHWHGDRERDGNRLALLFEGPVGPKAVGPILEILDAKDATAAFAIDMASALDQPGVLRRLDAGGHLLLNAGPWFAWSHLFHGYPAWHRAIDDTDDAIEQATARRPLLFVPPRGIKSPVMLREAAWGGYGLVTRARGQHRWLPGSYDRLRLGNAPASGIVAMRTDQARTPNQLAELIDLWRSRGRFLTRLDLLLNVPPYRHRDAVY